MYPMLRVQTLAQVLRIPLLPLFAECVEVEFSKGRLPPGPVR